MEDLKNSIISWPVTYIYFMIYIRDNPLETDSMAYGIRRFSVSFTRTIQ